MPSVRQFIPVGLAVTCTVLALLLANYVLNRERFKVSGRARFVRQISSTVIGLLGVLAVLATIPAGPEMRLELLKVYGLVVSAVIALSSTTFVGNMLGGFMMRSIGHIRPGDFVEVEGHFGRVSEQGLFSTEIQTPDRDLTTLPNLFLVSHPTTVVRKSGTIVAATVSLGYDIPRDKVENLLTEAARRADLEEPFVWVTELGNFSVTYRIAGFLSEVKELLSARSRLRTFMLDVLNESEIEIVSPTFMNQRVLEDGKTFIAKPSRKRAEPATDKPERVVFDKAEQAEALERLRAEYRQLEEQIEAENEKLKQADEGDGLRDRIRQRIEALNGRRDTVAKRLELSEKREK